MRYFALAVDFDGTIAHDGVVEDATIEALKQFKASGRKLVMVTGRELDELLGIFPHIELFDRIVAENGALIYRPDNKEIQVLSDPPSEVFVRELQKRKVTPLCVGRTIVATVEPHQEKVLEAIRKLGLELHVIFNKGAVMVLPSGVNKASGLKVALRELGLSPHNVIGVGDAENDHAFLSICECAVAVSNALPALKERADFVTSTPRGSGVVQLIEKVLKDELADISAKITRHHVRIGAKEDGVEESVDPYHGTILVCGTSGSGKSTLTTGLLERLTAHGYQFVIIDPEGDYTELDFSVALGNPQQAPLVDEVLDLLRNPYQNASVNLLGIAVEHRPGYFDALLPRLLEMRAKTGRPHWIVIDEAHHLLPAAWEPSAHHLPGEMHGAVYITVHSGSVSPPILEAINTLLVIGEEPSKTVKDFCGAIKKPIPKSPNIDKLPSGDALLWRPDVKETILVHTDPPKTERKRHSRKYAEGNLGPDRSFYFRGPEEKLNLKAHNLFMFLQIADGIDDETWEHHLRKGEYSTWFGEMIKDADLSEQAAAIEEDQSLTPQESRQAIRTLIEARYTLPADKASGIVDN